MTGRKIGRVEPWKWSDAEHATRDQRGGPDAQPRAQRAVEERAEEDLLGHRRHDDRPRWRRRTRHSPLLAELVDVGRRRPNSSM